MIITLIIIIGIITVSLAVIITVNHHHNGRHITAVGFSLPKIINISQFTRILRLKIDV